VPTRVATSFVADVSGTAGRATLAWQAPERFAYRPRSGVEAQAEVSVGGTRYLGLFPPPERGFSEVARRTHPARPDGFSFVSARFAAPVDVILGRARSGSLQLASATVAGRRAYTARISLPPNDCAALPRGTLRVWLDRATLLPLRLRSRGGRRRDTVSLRYRSINADLPRSAFRRPALGPRPARRDDGFVRTSPATADRAVSYAAELPATLPSGFRRAVTGWAPRSRQTGAEGSNPRYRELFAAVYRRGWERIDVTQRLAGRRGWLTDPFGFECGVVRTERVSVGGVAATFGEGPEIVPHLYWRDGRVLHTVSGPFSKDTLVEIAASLAPVGG